MQGPVRLTDSLRLFCKNFNYFTKWPSRSSEKDAVTCLPKNATTAQGIAVLNPRYGYPIHHHKWKILLNDAKSSQLLRRFSEDKTFAIHLWHLLSKGEFEYLTSPQSPYAAITSLHCPSTHKNCYAMTNNNTVL